jgi:hypothetical protein
MPAHLSNTATAPLPVCSTRVPCQRLRPRVFWLHLAPGMYNRVETRPGLDAFVSNPSGLRKAALAPLLAWASAVVPGGGGPAGAARTPLFLFATGGVRRMPAEQQGQLMSDVRDVLSGSGFRCVLGVDTGASHGYIDKESYMCGPNLAYTHAVCIPLRRFEVCCSGTRGLLSNTPTAMEEPWMN